MEAPNLQIDEFDEVESFAEDPVCKPGTQEVITETTLDSPKTYLRQINGKLLSVEQERELARRKDLGDETAKKQLIERNLLLVISIARAYQKNGVPLSDLIQEGNLGLIRAIEKFDYTMGNKLSTYATWWIRQGVQAAIANHARVVRLPVHTQAQIRKIEDARRELGKSKQDSVAEIAKRTGYSEKKVLALMEATQSERSLDESVAGDSSSSIVDNLPSTDLTSLEEVSQLEGSDTLDRAIEQLDSRHRLVVVRRYGLDGIKPETLEELSQTLGVSRERVRQLESQGLKKLRQKLGELGIIGSGDLLQ